jgi:serine/threonine-protein kinase
MSAVQTLSDLSPGFRIDGRYEVERLLGRGGCGAVYRCRDVRTSGTLCAVKLLDSFASAERFEREAQIQQKAKSRHVVKVHAVGQHQGRPYMVMDYLDGGSAAVLCGPKKKQDPRLAVWVVLMAIDGLKAMKGTVHRDLKPDNLLIDVHGIRGQPFIPDDPISGACILVTDFGLAKVLEENGEEKKKSLTQSGVVLGTPSYMSPEQCRSTKTVTQSADIYALGCILYELTTGLPPFHKGSAFDIMRSQVEEEPDLTKVPVQLQAVVKKCLAKDPKKRFGNLGALASALRKAGGLGKQKIIEPSASPKPGKTRSVLWATIILATVLLVLIIAIIMRLRG